MSIKRYIANKDNTITNAFKYNLIDRGVQSNMGQSDILEIFSIYGQANTSSLESSRILIQFPIEDIILDRNKKSIGESGTVNFILKLSNAVHGDSTPSGINLVISPVSASWSEGFGLDMESYLDVGTSNWLSSSDNVSWINPGGDVLSGYDYNVFLDTGLEDLEVDITDLVEDWIDSSVENNGLLISLTSSQENSNESFYTKKFFARGSEFFYKRPYIEARTNDSIDDDRYNFILSSSLLEEENLNTIILYNRFKGKLRNIPSVGTGSNIYVSLYSGLMSPEGVPLVLHNGETKIQAGFYKTGIYTASVAINTTASYLFDVWFSGSSAENTSSIIFATGSRIEPIQYEPEFDNENPEYVINIKNLKNRYSNDEKANFRIFARNKDWSPNIYTVASKNIENQIIDNLYYKILRVQDQYEVISYGTGSSKHTKASTDYEGQYFDLDMSIFEKGYAYEIRLGYIYGNNFYEFKENFKFRVE